MKVFTLVASHAPYISSCSKRGTMSIKALDCCIRPPLKTGVIVFMTLEEILDAYKHMIY